MRFKEFVTEGIYGIDDLSAKALKVELERYEEEAREITKRMKGANDSMLAMMKPTLISYQQNIKTIRKTLAKREEEESTSMQGLTHEKIAETLMRDCQPYLKQISYMVDYNILYRGMKGRPNIMFGKQKARLTDRLPTDSSHGDHNAMNEWFKTNFGHPYRNGIFATGTSTDAKTYGRPYGIFPIGDFEFVWSPMISDIYSELGEDPTGSEHWIETYIDMYGVDDIDMEDEDWRYNLDMSLVNVGDVLEHAGGYKDTDLKAAISSKHEVMLWVKDYYYIYEGLLPQVDEAIKSME